MTAPLFGGDDGSSLWERVEVSLRPLEDWERPVSGSGAEDRVIVIAREPGSHLPVAHGVGVYQPLEELSLLPDFMRLFAGTSRPRAARVIGFYGRYGALRQRITLEGELLPAWAGRLSAAARARLTPDARWLEEPGWWVEEQARELRLGYALYGALQEDNLVALRGMLGGVPEGKRIDRFALEAGQIKSYVADEEVLPGEQPRPRAGSAAVEQPGDAYPPGTPLRALTDEECRREGGRLLTAQLSAAMDRFSTTWSTQITSDGRARLVRFRTFPDLVTVMWEQLGDLIARGASYPICRGCGGAFLPTGKQRFCDKLCGDAWRQRHVYRKRQPPSPPPAGKARARDPRAKS
jgi:hypothetical protein